MGNSATGAFDEIEEVKATPQFGNCGPPGYGFRLWGTATNEETAHRRLLEAFAATHGDALLTLPPETECEDLIGGWLLWNGCQFRIWFETALNFTYLWVPEREPALKLRDAILPLAKKA